MALASNPKRKSARSKKDGPKLWIADWSIEPSTTPGEVHLFFVAVQESDAEAHRVTTRRFMLRCERAEEFVRELKEVLEDCATHGTEKHAASGAPVLAAQIGPLAARSMEDDTDSLSDHFALGAYGLVGN